MSDKLSPHFSLAEMTVSQTAIRRDIDNTPPAEIVENLATLCREVLEPIRSMEGVPLTVSSGYRCPRLNEAIRGSLKSRHMHGLAADFTIHGQLVTDTFRAIQKLDRSKPDFPLDKAILEFGRWIHVQMPLPGKEPKHAFLIASRVNGRTSYRKLKS